MCDTNNITLPVKCITIVFSVLSLSQPTGTFQPSALASALAPKVLPCAVPGCLWHLLLPDRQGRQAAGAGTCLCTAEGMNPATHVL